MLLTLQSARRALRSRRGIASLEYAVMAAGLVGMVAASGNLMGVSTASALGQVNCAVGACQASGGSPAAGNGAGTPSPTTPASAGSGGNNGGNGGGRGRDGERGGDGGRDGGDDD